MKIDLAALDCLSDETNKAIHAVNLTSSEIRPEKISGPFGVWTHDLRDTVARIALFVSSTAVHIYMIFIYF